MTWQLQDNPNLAPSIIERSHSFDESTRKPLAIIFASVALPKTGKKYIFYLVRCDIVNNGVPPFCQIRPAAEIVANEATQERRSCPAGDRNTREVQILAKNVECREQTICLRVSPEQHRWAVVGYAEMRKGVTANVLRLPVIMSGLIAFSLRINQRLIRKPRRISPSKNNKAGKCKYDNEIEGGEGGNRAPGRENSPVPDRCLYKPPRENSEQERERDQTQAAGQGKRPQAPIVAEGKERPVP